MARLRHRGEWQQPSVASLLPRDEQGTFGCSRVLEAHEGRFITLDPTMFN
jgi:hypothetical protein